MRLFRTLILIITGWEEVQPDRKDHMLDISGSRAVLPIQIAFSVNIITNILSVLAQCSFTLQLAVGIKIIHGIIRNPLTNPFTIEKNLLNKFFGALPSQQIIFFMVAYALVGVIIATILGAQNIFAELHGLGL
ncbi:MAG: hypothetical protein H7196_01495 [candidate division SR1 bacterium]|nr:hypothetical protein [candidate division SR1 bacterium]